MKKISESKALFEALDILAFGIVPFATKKLKNLLDDKLKK